jgi:hypothetical protein
MPAAIAIPALATVIGGGAAAGATMYGAHKQASASRDAARIGNDYNNRALDFAREQYGAEEARRAPFRAMANSINAWQMQGSPMAPPPPGPRPIRAGTIGSLIPRG